MYPNHYFLKNFIHVAQQVPETQVVPEGHILLLAHWQTGCWLKGHAGCPKVNGGAKQQPPPWHEKPLGHVLDETQVATATGPVGQMGICGQHPPWMHAVPGGQELKGPQTFTAGSPEGHVWTGQQALSKHWLPENFTLKFAQKFLFQ